jgi:hypothetical protein
MFRIGAGQAAQKAAERKPVPAKPAPAKPAPSRGGPVARVQGALAMALKEDADWKEF